MGTKSDDKLDKMVAITTAIISVLLAIASILGNKAGGDSTLYLIKSTDQWSYYQSKSIKLNLYESNKEMLMAELANPANPKEYSDAIKKKISDFDANINKYNKEKQNIQAEAQKFQALSEHYNDKSDNYNYANGFYQVSIILAAIALLAKKRYMWILSCILGIAGLGLSVYAFLLPV